MDTLWQDLRGGIRVLINAPGFALTAILMLALGIGASTSIFSVADAVLLRPLPYPQPDQIVRIWEQASDGHTMNVAQPNFQDFAAQNATFSSLGEYGSALSSLSGGTEPVRVEVAGVSTGFFKTLGVGPVRGRLFSADEQRPHGSPAILVSYGYWRRCLGSATDLSRFQLRMQGSVYPVIGVMPAGFDFPNGIAAWISSETDPDTSDRTAHNWRVIGRVRNGVSIAKARANLSTIAHRIRKQYGKDVDLTDASVMPLSEALVGDVRTALLTLLAAVGLLLLVACANVAGLVLARTSARRKELAVRAALGAGRGRLVQQFLGESFALSFSGGALGIGVAALAIRILPAILPTNLPRQQDIALNAPVLLFAISATVAVAVALGLFAAWRAGSGDLREALGSGSRSFTGSGQRLRSVLVIAEISTTLVILMGATLLGRSFIQLISTSPGFHQQSLITMEFTPPLPEMTASGPDQAAIARQIHLMDNITARLESIPGVGSVGLSGAMPVAAGDDLADGNFLILRGDRAPATFDQWGKIAKNPSQVGYALYSVASEGYFRTLGIPLIRGRLFGAQDDIHAPNVAVISQALAHERWPHEDPIGQVIDFGNMDGNLKPQTIVGIVGDVRARGLNLPPSPLVYVPYRQRGIGMFGNSSPTILVHSAAPPGQITSAARGIFHELAPDSPVKFSTFAEEMGGWLSARRFLLTLVGLFGAAALALAAIGVYGVVAFSVTRRTQEIGIRMAIGAQRAEVLSMILQEGARMAVGGVAIGIGISLLTLRLISSLMFGVKATDPITFVAVAVLLTTVALAASYLPAYRATRVDPMRALRNE